MMPSGWLAATVVLLRAGAPEATLGFFDPYAPFSSPLERAEFAERAAQALSRGGEQIVRGEAYSKSSDLARDVAAGRIQLGFVNPQFLGRPGRDAELVPLLTGTRDGSPTCTYALYAATKSRVKNLMQLRGRRLAIVRTGAADEQFVFNAILEGEVRDSDFFKTIVPVPDLAGAVGTLRFGRAEAFFGPELDYRKRFKNRAIRRIARAGSSLCLLFVAGRALPPAEREGLVRTVQASMTRLRPVLRTIGIDGFAPIPEGTLASLRDAMRSDPARYGLALPRLLSPTEPRERDVLRAIQEMESGLLPRPSDFVIERNAL